MELNILIGRFHLVKFEFNRIKLKLLDSLLQEISDKFSATRPLKGLIKCFGGFFQLLKMAVGGLATGQGLEAQLASRSWASVLGSLPPASENKNVLEVILEKDFRGSFNVSDSDCLNLIRRLGFDTRPGIHLEEVQICPNGRGIIYLTLKKELDVGKFCCYDVIQVTSGGIRAVNVKPSGKREVVVTLS